MAKWVRGQSGNPKGRPLRGRSVAELARAIALERVAFSDGNAEEIVCSRLERLLRVLFTRAIEEADVPAARCLFEYMDGKPIQMVAATVKSEGGGSLSADELGKELVLAMADQKSWHQERETSEPLAQGGNSSHAG